MKTNVENTLITIALFTVFPIIHGCSDSSAPNENEMKLSLGKGVTLELVHLPNGLWFSKYEVTQKQWVTIMGTNPSEFEGENHPVENVSAHECQDFLDKINALPSIKSAGFELRLPKNTEWEYACRAGTTNLFCRLADGTDITASMFDEVAWFADNSEDKTHRVGLKKPNAFGLYDMIGNVSEIIWEEDDSVRYGCRGGDWTRSTSDLFKLEYPELRELELRGYMPSINPRRSSRWLGFRICCGVDSFAIAKECLSNRRQIAIAAENWLTEQLIEHKTETKALGSSIGIKRLLDEGYFNKEPKCPAGGIYSIIVDSDWETDVKCSIPEHSEDLLPQ